MAARNKARTTTSAQRRRTTSTASSRPGAPEPAAESPTPFRASTLYAIGLILVALALILFAVLAVLTFRGADLRILTGGEQWGENLDFAPLALLMVAAIPLFLAEFQRRGQWTSRDRGPFQGGTNVVVTRRMRLWARALWIAVSVFIWMVVLAIPVALEISTEVVDEADTSFWDLLVLHGLVAAGITGVLVFSLIKRLTYDILAVRFADQVVPGSFSQGFWRFVSYQFRLELWFAFGCGAALGAIPLLYQSAAESCYTDSCVLIPEPAWAAGVFWIALGTGATALTLSLNAWRSGELLESGESVS